MLTAEQAKNIKLSKNFTLFELIRSDQYPEAVVYPSEEIIGYLKDFCEKILQPLRDKFGPIRINSGYRNPRLNKLVGGVSNSIHQIVDDRSDIFLGCAADIVPLRANVVKVFEALPDMLKDETLKGLKTAIIYRKPGVTRSPFIHVDTRMNREGVAFLEKINTRLYVNYYGSKK